MGRHTIKAGFQGILIQAADNANKGFGGTVYGHGRIHLRSEPADLLVLHRKWESRICCSTLWIVAACPVVQFSV